MIRISIGLASIVASSLFAAYALGLVPDRERILLQGRKSLCEAEAIHCALALRHGNEVDCKAALLALLERNPEILSSAVRRADGRLVVEVGDHRAHWGEGPGEESTLTHLYVPLALTDKVRGTFELCFQGDQRASVLAILKTPIIPLTVFVTGTSFLLTLFYLRNV